MACGTTSSWMAWPAAESRNTKRRRSSLSDDRERRPDSSKRVTARLTATLVEPFQRGTARVHTDHAGVGLGLAIVKSITQAHDGTLALTPRPAGGLCVTVHLPAAPPQPGG